MMDTQEGLQMAKEKEKTEQVAFRLPASLVKRLDDHASRMAAERPGEEVGRADALRSLLAHALNEAEAKAEVRRKVSR